MRLATGTKDSVGRGERLNSSIEKFFVQDIRTLLLKALQDCGNTTDCSVDLSL